MTAQSATYFTHLGYVALITVGGMTVAGFLYKFLYWLDERRKDVITGWKAGTLPKEKTSDDGLTDAERAELAAKFWKVAMTPPEGKHFPAARPPDEGYPQVGKAPDGSPMEDAPSGVLAPDPEKERRLAQYMAKLSEHRELAEGVLAVRCPVCRSPEAVTCNPEMPEGMAVVHLDRYKFAHGLRIVKAAGQGKAPAKLVLENLPDDDLGQLIREGLAEGPSDSAES